MANVLNMGGGGANVESRTVKSTESTQTITPGDGVDGFNPVIVNPISLTDVYCSPVSTRGVVKVASKESQGADGLRDIYMLGTGCPSYYFGATSDIRENADNFLYKVKFDIYASYFNDGSHSLDFIVGSGLDAVNSTGTQIVIITGTLVTESLSDMYFKDVSCVYTQNGTLGYTNTITEIFDTSFGVNGASAVVSTREIGGHNFDTTQFTFKTLKPFAHSSLNARTVAALWT